MEKRIGRILSNTLFKKRWRNIGDFCDRKHHPLCFPYRRYRRGKNRCLICGAKIGQVKCARKSCSEILYENLFESRGIIELFGQRDRIKVR